MLRRLSRTERGWVTALRRSCERHLDEWSEWLAWVAATVATSDFVHENAKEQPADEKLWPVLVALDELKRRRRRAGPRSRVSEGDGRAVAKRPPVQAWIDDRRWNLVAKPLRQSREVSRTVGRRGRGHQCATPQPGAVRTVSDLVVHRHGVRVEVTGIPLIEDGDVYAIERGVEDTASLDA